MMKFITVFTILFFPLITIAQISGTVAYVSDGDTFTFYDESGDKIRVRVADIDCPEKDQSFGLEAKEFTMSQLKGKSIQLEVKEIDRYNRTVAYVKYDSKDLSEMLIINGLAWHYKKYSKKPHYQDLEDQAKIQKIGLWSTKNPLAP